MADMQITVRLGGESRLNAAPPFVRTLVLLDNLVNEVPVGFLFGGIRSRLRRCGHQKILPTFDIQNQRSKTFSARTCIAPPRHSAVDCIGAGEIENSGHLPGVPCPRRAEWR